MNVGRHIKDRSSTYLISDYEDFDLIKNSLTRGQIEVLDKIVRKIVCGKIYLYYHKDNCGNKIYTGLYTGLYAGHRPYGCELIICMWYEGEIGVEAVINSIRNCVTEDGKRILKDAYDEINYIGDGVAAIGPMYAMYTDDDLKIYIKEILCCKGNKFVFVVMDNNTLKRYKVHGNGRQMYFNYNDNKIKLSKLEYL